MQQNLCCNLNYEILDSYLPCRCFSFRKEAGLPLRFAKTTGDEVKIISKLDEITYYLLLTPYTLLLVVKKIKTKKHPLGVFLFLSF